MYQFLAFYRDPFPLTCSMSCVVAPVSVTVAVSGPIFVSVSGQPQVAAVSLRCRPSPLVSASSSDSSPSRRRYRRTWAGSSSLASDICLSVCVPAGGGW